MAHLTDIYYNTSGTLKTIFRQARNSQQIYTEAKLEYALENESVDVGFFYKCEQLWNSGNLRFIPLPAKLDMSDKDLNSYYSKVRTLTTNLKISIMPCS